MVKIALQIKATLNNIVELKPFGHEVDDFHWHFKFVCSSCGTQTEKWNDMSLNDKISAQHGRDFYNFSCKCKLCSRVNTLTIIPDSIKSYIAEDEEKFQTIVVLDCRGMEPYTFSARDGWSIKLPNGLTLFNIDLSEGEYYDYHEQVLEITEFQYKFERIK